MSHWTQTYPALPSTLVGDWRSLYPNDREDHVVDIRRFGTRGKLYRSRAVQKYS